MSITSSIDISQVSPLRVAFDRYRSVSRMRRAARAEQARLIAELSEYRSGTDRAEMESILSRYPDSDAARAWNQVAFPTTIPAFARN